MGITAVLVVGAGLTGIELACEMPERMKALGIRNGRTILVDRNSHVGSNMGIEAQAVILKAITSLGIEVRTKILISSVDCKGIALKDGTRIDAATIVWTAGMSANPLTRSLPVEHDDQVTVLVPVPSAPFVVGVNGVDGAEGRIEGVSADS